MFAGPTLVIVDATFAVNAVRRGGRADGKDTDSVAPNCVPLTLIAVPAIGDYRSRPVAINPREDARAGLPLTLIVPLLYARTHCRPLTRRRVTGMSEQAVLGGSDTGVRRHVIFPEASMMALPLPRLSAWMRARFNSGSRVS